VIAAAPIFNLTHYPAIADLAAAILVWQRSGFHPM
jgi:hypothetical protein